MPAPFLGSASGLSRQQLRGLRYRRLSRDVYAFTPAAETLALNVDALLTALPDAVISHHTAARLLGLPVDDDQLLHVTRTRSASVSERPGVRTHRVDLSAADVHVLGGRPVTRPQRTFLDLAACLSPVSLVVLADAVTRRVGVAAVERRLATASGARGVRRARTALALADPLSDSPAETRTRLTLRGAGFTELRHGIDVSDPYGGWLARPDLADRKAKIAIQYDGLIHLGDDPERRRADIDRDELLRQDGWQVVVLTAVDLRRPDGMIAKVAAAYRRASR